MRTVALAILVAALGCSSDPVEGGPGPGDPGEADASPPPVNGFRIETPELTIAPGDERTYCYYTSLPNDQVAGIKRWSSTMTPGSHHLIVYFTSTANQPDGTVTEECGLGASLGNIPIWAYAASQPEANFPMPDGIGMTAEARQPLFVQLHYLNAGSTELQVRAVVDAETFGPEESFTQAYAFITYNTEIDIAAGQEGFVSGTCDVPSGVKFFSLSTHAHRFNTRATISDGDAMLVESLDWEHPSVEKWQSEPFYTFGSTLNYRCEYRNTSEERVQEGDSARTDEMCMAIGYYFPATRPSLCLNSYNVPF